MTPAQIEKYRKAAEDGTIPDAENPLFLFQGIPSSLLIRALNKEFSFTELAKRELAESGLNVRGEWAGFKNATRKKPAQQQRRRL